VQDLRGFDYLLRKRDRQDDRTVIVSNDNIAWNGRSIS
jgi:hypothetical protein